MLDTASRGLLNDVSRAVLIKISSFQAASGQRPALLGHPPRKEMRDEERLCRSCKHMLCAQLTRCQPTPVWGNLKVEDPWKK